MFALIVFLAQSNVLLAVSLSEGREFLVSTPSTLRMHDSYHVYPRLVLVMQSFFNMTVTIMTIGIHNEDYKVNLTVELSQSKAQYFYKNYLHYSSDFANGPRWSYHLKGDKPFGLLISMEDSDSIVETFTCVPVEGWGTRYYAMTLSDKVSVVLINHQDDNEVTVIMRSSDDRFQITNAGDKQGENFVVTLAMSQYDSYAVSTCQRTGAPGSMTGSEITGKYPLGVVTGNCRAATVAMLCNAKEERPGIGPSGSVVAEMLLPYETFGKNFIVFEAYGRNSPGLLMIVAWTNGTLVSITGPKSEQIWLNAVGEWVTRASTNGFLRCSKSCQVMYIQYSSCIEHNSTRVDGSPSFLLVTPIELYYFAYLCILPDSKMTHYLTATVPEKLSADALHFIEADRQIPEKKATINNIVTTSKQHERWEIITYKVLPTKSLVVYSTSTRFGCFLHGLSKESTYMHVAGFISSNIKVCQRSEQTMYLNDLLDNDCDGWVDEESDNSKDDDEDEQVDEDQGITLTSSQTPYDYLPVHPGVVAEKKRSKITRTTVVAKKTTVRTTPANRYTTLSPDVYENWSDWACSRDCNFRDMIRTRQCKKNGQPTSCTRPEQETKMSDCYQKICPLECPDTFFGDDCQYSCKRCTSPCDKFNGSCASCQEGYDYPASGCQLEIKSHQEWTSWQCTEDCQNSKMVRKRVCQEEEIDSSQFDCTKVVVETMPGNCYVGKICPKDCPDYEWGIDCLGTCEHCTTPCVKFTGICMSCRPGFHMPWNACRTPCGANQFGQNCSGDCRLKCGEDCLDRVQGNCRQYPMSKLYIIVGVLFAAFVGTGGFLIFKRGQANLHQAAMPPPELATSKSSMSKVSKSSIDYAAEEYNTLKEITASTGSDSSYSAHE